MMYVMITTRCNMTCCHCAYSCTAEGEDMSMDTFRRAIDFMHEWGEEPISIGGGERTG